MGLLYVRELEDCAAATETLEELRTRFPKYSKMEEVLFNLYYCYNKHGEIAKAGAIKTLMNQQYAGSKLTTIVTTGKDPLVNEERNTSATKTYEKVYDLFIEGNFDEAIARKKQADSIYGSNHWTPQLLYIESVYYIKQRQDSSAAVVLNNIITQFGGTPLADKATTLLNVLSRRSQIERELQNMVITMPPPDTTERQSEIIVSGKPITNLPPVKNDSINAPGVKPPVAITRPAFDTANKQPVKQVPGGPAYTYEAGTPHYVVVVLTKVDPIFVNEAKNAFARYNRDTYYNKQMQAELVDIDADNRLLLISPFTNAAEALLYVEQTRPKTASEIIPWLKGGKYSYSIITDKNLGVLKDSKDLDKYKQFLDKNVPGKF
jgi:outer membrane protein assembly factor BamD (BamD/ComL family)